MSDLMSIQATAQQVAEAVSAALGVETEIVDDELTVVAGTGKYRQRIGTKEEGGDPSAGFLYGRVLRTGQSFVVEDPASDPTYDPRSLTGETEEQAEICCPVVVDGRVVGVLGLSAMNAAQREILLGKQREMLQFLHRMAELLASKVREHQAITRLSITSSQLGTILESIGEGVLAIDEGGFISHCNRSAEVLIGLPRRELLGRHLSALWPDSPMLTVLATGQGYREREEMYQRPRPGHFLVTAFPVRVEGAVKGVVATFRAFSEVRRLVRSMTDTRPVCTFADIKGTSPAILRVKEQAMQVAASDVTVLICGESGTGKEMFARAIHAASPRAAGPFVVINCGAIPETLLESELFGYEGGAFTGARREGKPGKFELASGGTIFLDEIGDMPLHLQVKLLRVLQDHVVERVGGTRPIPVDVRVIAASNRDLEQMMHDHEFREDLYFRLSVIPLQIPPLRERREDIPLLAEYFLDNQRHLVPKEVSGFSRAVLEAFLAYDWPGNVRELQNTVEYAVHLAKGPTITLDSLPPRLRRHTTAPGGGTLREQVRRFEASLIQACLARYGSGSRAVDQAARELGISRASLYRKLRTTPHSSRRHAGAPPARQLPFLET
ncbi:MAG: sigma 54-interacting transcriptional regulator [Bacillota bacterium]